MPQNNLSGLCEKKLIISCFKFCQKNAELCRVVVHRLNQTESLGINGNVHLFHFSPTAVEAIIAYDLSKKCHPP